MSFKVVEIFESINGEAAISHAIIVIRCGQISLIVNLRR